MPVDTAFGEGRGGCRTSSDNSSFTKSKLCLCSTVGARCSPLVVRGGMAAQGGRGDEAALRRGPAARCPSAGGGQPALGRP